MDFVILPLKSEFNIWINLLGEIEPTEVKRFYKASLGEKTILTTYGGLGYRILRRIKEGVDNFAVDRIIHLGSAGGLNPDVKIGSVVLASEVVQKTSEIKLNLENILLAELVKSIKPDIHIIQGRILTLKNPVFSRAKAELYYNEFKVDCIDMESYHVARFCRENHIPCTILRGISDFADHATPSIWKQNLNTVIRNCYRVAEKILFLLS